MISNTSLDLLNVLSEGWEKKNKKMNNKSVSATNVENNRNVWDGVKEGSKENALAFARMVGSVK